MSWHPPYTTMAVRDPAKNPSLSFSYGNRRRLSALASPLTHPGVVCVIRQTSEPLLPCLGFSTTAAACKPLLLLIMHPPANGTSKSSLPTLTCVCVNEDPTCTRLVSFPPERTTPEKSVDPIQDSPDMGLVAPGGGRVERARPSFQTYRLVVALLY